MNDSGENKMMCTHSCKEVEICLPTLKYLHVVIYGFHKKIALFKSRVTCHCTVLQNVVILDWYIIYLLKKIKGFSRCGLVRLFLFVVTFSSFFSVGIKTGFCCFLFCRCDFNQGQLPCLKLVGSSDN